VLTFLPHFLAMIVLLALGTVAAWLTRIVVGAVLRAVRFDAFSYRLGLTETLSRAAVRGAPSLLLARLLAGVVFLVFLLFGLSALDIPQVDMLVLEFFDLIPRFLAALFVFVGGALLSLFLGRAVLIAAVNANVTFARTLSEGVRALVLIFFFAVALEHLRIGEGIVVAAFSILFGGAVFALALAFGLGGRDLAKDYLERRLTRPSEEEAEGRRKISHL
jgi:hypothetical protein